MNFLPAYFTKWSKISLSGEHVSHGEVQVSICRTGPTEYMPKWRGSEFNGVPLLKVYWPMKLFMN